MRFVSLALALGLLCGCVTVQNSKTLSVEPHDGPVAVTSTARAQCWDLFLVLYCRLNLEIETSTGKRVSDFPGR